MFAVRVPGGPWCRGDGACVACDAGEAGRSSRGRGGRRRERPSGSQGSRMEVVDAQWQWLGRELIRAGAVRRVEVEMVPSQVGAGVDSTASWC
ncbi:hypothetical protein IMZ48_41355 [Candidatus Bathyarchaeota archaeon]|nr:hypothetical protein [Candidatus Bathyarchaeota archaeon]